MTHAGAMFKPHLDALLHHLDDGIAAVGQLIDPDTGTVVLAFQQSLGTWLVPDLVRSFRAAHPGVGFRLTQVRTNRPRRPSTAGTPTSRSASAGRRTRAGGLPRDPGLRGRPGDLPDLVRGAAPAPGRRVVPQACHRPGRRGPTPRRRIDDMHRARLG